MDRNKDNIVIFSESHIDGDEACSDYDKLTGKCLGSVDRRQCDGCASEFQ